MILPLTPATTLSPQIKPKIRRSGDFQSDLCFLPDGWGFRANNKNPTKTSWSLPPTDTKTSVLANLCSSSEPNICGHGDGRSLFLRKFISSCWMLLELSRTAAWIRNSQIRCTMWVQRIWLSSCLMGPELAEATWLSAIACCLCGWDKGFWGSYKTFMHQDRLTATALSLSVGRL